MTLCSQRGSSSSSRSSNVIIVILARPQASRLLAAGMSWCTNFLPVRPHSEPFFGTLCLLLAATFPVAAKFSFLACAMKKCFHMRELHTDTHVCIYIFIYGIYIVSLVHVACIYFDVARIDARSGAAATTTSGR